MRTGGRYPTFVSKSNVVIVEFVFDGQTDSIEFNATYEGEYTKYISRWVLVKLDNLGHNECVTIKQKSLFEANESTHSNLHIIQTVLTALLKGQGTKHLQTNGYVLNYLC